MILILCADDQGGIMFNHRRQSQDRAVRQAILHLTNEKPLFVSPYTAKQFAPEEQERLHISENFLHEAEKGAFCFAEDTDISGIENEVEQLILFKWNRLYPADILMTIPLENWKLAETENFAGYSHEKITKEVYVR